MILELKKDPTKQVHEEGLIITDEDVDDIVKEWPKEQYGPLVETLPVEQNQEDPPANQGEKVGMGDNGNG